jgi:A/G-specific adenine glycosylase
MDGFPSRDPVWPERRERTPGEEQCRVSGATTLLLEWFEGRERDVPGRNESDPYRVWVAEVMAQQTRISTVIPYYESFLARFPDVATLAEAPLDDVLKRWEGLGYYGRARNLHRAAREVQARYAGRLPEDPDILRSLPGIGSYTAGAISSIAFGRAEPAVDGNVRRVLSRLYDLERATPARLEAQMRDLIGAGPGGTAGRLNQALMDLGSSICTPRSPGCDQCPVIGLCVARRNGTIDLRPGRKERGTVPHRDIGAALVWRDRRILIARRPERGLLGGLWEFPGGKVEAGETPAQAARREVREELGVEAEVIGMADTVAHAFSHFRITLHLYHARWLAGGPSPGRTGTESPRWVLPEELGRYAFPAANRTIIRRLVSGEERAPRSRDPA